LLLLLLLLLPPPLTMMKVLPDRSGPLSALFIDTSRFICNTAAAAAACCAGHCPSSQVMQQHVCAPLSLSESAAAAAQHATRSRQQQPNATI
jgi:hypothetical protein